MTDNRFPEGMTAADCWQVFDEWLERNEWDGDLLAAVDAFAAANGEDLPPDHPRA